MGKDEAWRFIEKAVEKGKGTDGWCPAKTIMVLVQDANDIPAVEAEIDAAVADGRLDSKPGSSDLRYIPWCGVSGIAGLLLGVMAMINSLATS